MSDRARNLLLDEQGRLEDELAKVTAALKALDGGDEKPKRKATPKREWPAEKITCPDCGYKAKAPQGLSAHRRQQHEKAESQEAGA